MDDANSFQNIKNADSHASSVTAQLHTLLPWIMQTLQHMGHILLWERGACAI